MECKVLLQLKFDLPGRNDLYGYLIQEAFFLPSQDRYLSDLVDKGRFNLDTGLRIFEQVQDHCATNGIGFQVNGQESANNVPLPWGKGTIKQTNYFIGPMTEHEVIAFRLQFSEYICKSPLSK